MVGREKFVGHLIAIKAEIALPPPRGAIGPPAGHVLNLARCHSEESQSGLLFRLVGIVHDYLVVIPRLVGRNDELSRSSLDRTPTRGQLDAEGIEQGYSGLEPQLDGHRTTLQGHLARFDGYSSSVAVGPSDCKLP